MPEPSRTGCNSRAGASSCISCRPTVRISEMRTVGRHEMQDDAPARLLQPVLDGSGMMVAGVIEEDVDAAHRRIGPLQRGEQVDGALRVDGLDFLDAGLSGLQVDRAVQVQPLAPGRHIDRATLATWQP